MNNRAETITNYSFQFAEMPSYVALSSIGRYRFRNPISFTVYNDEESFVHIESKEADLFAVGKTVEEACQDLNDELDFAWKTYVESGTDNLHESALKYREWLKDNVERTPE